jgi:SAM-dependent methyltransferase
MNDQELTDWIASPNIHQHPDIYELENQALARDGRLDSGLKHESDWTDRVLLDIGCGTGFWLPKYANAARRVVGVEPDPKLLKKALARTDSVSNVEVASGSAEHLPLVDDSVDIAHARFAYFFGDGAETGLNEVLRVLRPGGVFIAIDNSWRGGEFATLLDMATTGNAAFDPAATQDWWAEHGAQRVEIDGAWQCRSPAELERVLRIEFPDEIVDRFLSARKPTETISYHFALFVVRKPEP